MIRLAHRRQSVVLLLSILIAYNRPISWVWCSLLLLTGKHSSGRHIYIYIYMVYSSFSYYVHDKEWHVYHRSELIHCEKGGNSLWKTNTFFSESIGWFYVYVLIKESHREYRRSNQKWTIQGNWQQDEEKQNRNTTHYVLDTTMRKQDMSPPTIN